MDKKVCAIVVTYNRKELLQVCLEALLRQERVPDTILVIDNGSHDDTVQAIRQGFPVVMILALEENLGGAGGFYLGMKWAYENGMDWMWLMDDDCLPDPEALNQLLKLTSKYHLQISGPLVVDRDDRMLLSFGLSDKIKTVQEALALEQNGLIPDRLNPFNGTLIAREVIERIGYIKPEMFIWGDEEEYILRARTNRVNIGTIPSAVIRHPSSKGIVKKILGGTLGGVLTKPENMATVYYRNLGYLNKVYRGSARLLWTLIKYTIYYLINRRMDLKGLWSFYRYYLDGVTDRYALPPSRRSYDLPQ